VPASGDATRTEEEEEEDEEEEEEAETAGAAAAAAGVDRVGTLWLIGFRHSGHVFLKINHWSTHAEWNS